MRPSVVVPIGVIVAVAIVCVVVAALTSAQRADSVALDNERQLFTRALTTQGERVLRDISAVATSEAAYRRIRTSFDSDWVQISVGSRLQSFFDHDFVFVTDPSDHLLYASLGRRSVDPNWFNSVQSDLQPVLDAMRGRVDPGDGVAIDVTGLGTHRAARLQSFLGRPAMHTGLDFRAATGQTPASYAQSVADTTAHAVDAITTAQAIQPRSRPDSPNS